MSRPFEYPDSLWKDDAEPPFRSKLPPPIAAPATDDPTFAYRRKLENMCDAVMLRVVELEEAADRMKEAAKKLRAAVMAATE